MFHSVCVGGVDKKNSFKKYWTIRKEISEFIKKTITIEFFYGFEADSSKVTRECWRKLEPFFVK